MELLPIAFGGKVSHKGLHVREGTRVVFVASFSKKRSSNDERGNGKGGGDGTYLS